MKTTAKNIVVLGSDSALGSVLIARASERPGANVLAVSRRPAPKLAAGPKNVTQLHGIDLTNEGQLNELARATADRFKEPFSVVHSVGQFWTHKPLVSTPFADIIDMFQSQVITLIGAAKVLTPVMKNNGGGKLVAFSCNSVAYNYPDMSPFTASKAAIECFVRSYANEHSEFGIASCAIALPTMRTPKVLKEKLHGDHENYIRPEDLADFILDNVLTAPTEVTGNVIKLFKYSRTFYHSSYYARNPPQDG